MTSPTTVFDNKCKGGQIPDDMDFSPCTACILDNTGELEVRCELVNMTDVRDGPFQSLDNLNIDFLYLTIIDGDTIPDNFLGSAVNKVNSFSIDCTDNESLLDVTQSAFGNGSVAEFNNFYITNCNLLTLYFLSGMKRLDELKFENSSNLHEILAAMPTDFSTKVLAIKKCKNLNAIDTVEKLPLSSSRLQQFLMTDNEDLNEETVDLFLNWLIDSSLSTLEILYLYNNGLTKIPADILKFTFLTKFRFDGNPIQDGVVLKGSLDFLYGIYELDLSSCGINIIQPGTFLCNSLIHIFLNILMLSKKLFSTSLCFTVADFKFSVVSLASNNLTRLDYEVFYILFRRIFEYGSGMIYLFES